MKISTNIYAFFFYAVFFFHCSCWVFCRSFYFEVNLGNLPSPSPNCSETQCWLTFNSLDDSFQFLTQLPGLTQSPNFPTQARNADSYSIKILLKPNSSHLLNQEYDLKNTRIDELLLLCTSLQISQDRKPQVIFVEAQITISALTISVIGIDLNLQTKTAFLLSSKTISTLKSEFEDGTAVKSSPQKEKEKEQLTSIILANSSFTNNQISYTNSALILLSERNRTVLAAKLVVTNSTFLDIWVLAIISTADSPPLANFSLLNLEASLCTVINSVVIAIDLVGPDGSLLFKDLNLFSNFYVDSLVIACRNITNNAYMNVLNIQSYSNLHKCSSLIGQLPFQTSSDNQPSLAIKIYDLFMSDEEVVGANCYQRGIILDFQAFDVILNVSNLVYQKSLLTLPLFSLAYHNNVFLSNVTLDSCVIREGGQVIEQRNSTLVLESIKLSNCSCNQSQYYLFSKPNKKMPYLLLIYSIHVHNSTFSLCKGLLEYGADTTNHNVSISDSTFISSSVMSIADNMLRNDNSSSVTFSRYIDIANIYISHVVLQESSLISGVGSIDCLLKNIELKNITLEKRSSIISALAFSDFSLELKLIVLNDSKFLSESSFLEGKPEFQHFVLQQFNSTNNFFDSSLFSFSSSEAAFLNCNFTRNNHSATLLDLRTSSLQLEYCYFRGPLKNTTFLEQRDWIGKNVGKDASLLDRLDLTGIISVDGWLSIVVKNCIFVSLMSKDNPVICFHHKTGGNSKVTNQIELQNLTFDANYMISYSGLAPLLYITTLNPLEVTLYNLTFRNNYLEQSGYHMYQSSTISIIAPVGSIYATKTEAQNNSANSATSGFYLNVYLADIRNSTFESNYMEFSRYLIRASPDPEHMAGTLLLDAVRVIIKDNKFLYNTVTSTDQQRNGGTIFISLNKWALLYYNTDPTITIDNNAFLYNAAIYGGAVAITNPNDVIWSKVVISNCNIIENVAEVEGGGIYFSNKFRSESEVKIINTTFAGNDVLEGQGDNIYLQISTQYQMKLLIDSCQVNPDGDSVAGTFYFNLLLGEVIIKDMFVNFRNKNGSFNSFIYSEASLITNRLIMNISSDFNPNLFIEESLLPVIKVVNKNYTDVDSIFTGVINYDKYREDAPYSILYVTRNDSSHTDLILSLNGTKFVDLSYPIIGQNSFSNKRRRDGTGDETDITTILVGENYSVSFFNVTFRNISGVAFQYNQTNSKNIATNINFNIQCSNLRMYTKSAINFAAQVAHFNLFNSSFQNCTTKGNGSAIRLVGQKVTFQNVTIKNCRASHGGGLIVSNEFLAEENGTIALSDVVFEDNQVEIMGGAIYYDNFWGYSSMKTSMINVEFKNNLAYCNPASSVKALNDEKYGNDQASTPDGLVIFDSNTGKTYPSGTFIIPNQRSGTLVKFSNNIIKLRFIDYFSNTYCQNTPQVVLVSQINPINEKSSFIAEKSTKDGEIELDLSKVFVYDAPGNFSLSVLLECTLGVHKYIYKLGIATDKCLPGETAGRQGSTAICFNCSIGTYSLAPSVECRNCPAHFTCFGGNNIKIDKGYWVPELTDPATKLEAYSCDNDHCEGSDFTKLTFGDEICSENYGGPLCAGCKAPFLEIQPNKCQKCDADKFKYSLSFLGQLLIYICVIGLNILITIKSNTLLYQSGTKGKDYGVLLRIFNNYTQYLQVCSALGLGSTLR